MDIRLKSHNVVGAEILQKFSPLRQCREYAGGDKRNMQEEARSVGEPQFPQRSRQRDEMIVMHPDQIVRTQQLRERMCERPIDAAVSVQMLAAKLDQP